MFLNSTDIVGQKAFSDTPVKEILHLKPVSHRGRSEYVCTRSGQIPVLVNIAELLVGFPINQNPSVATSA